jgi:hypothetical protein
LQQFMTGLLVTIGYERHGGGPMIVHSMNRSPAILP